MMRIGITCRWSAAVLAALWICGNTAWSADRRAGRETVPMRTGENGTERPLADTYGAEANPTGQPIGGGEGYTAGPKRDDARFHVANLEALQRALKAAKPEDIVWIESGSTIDFTGTRIAIPPKVTLAGDRGVNGSMGPLLTARHRSDELFIVMGEGARVTGFRVQGANPLMKDIDEQKSDPAGYGVSCVNGEVDNMEISRFQRGGVALFRNSDFSHIHHNHIHDVASYPVFIANGTGDRHVIEANRIEWAWHAVGSNGSRGSGYTVRYNIFVRVPRPKSFDEHGADPPNWCLDVHANDGAPTRPSRPATRKLVVHHNSFTAHPDVKVGDGSDLLRKLGLYPKHDVYVGYGKGMTTTVEVYRNRFLMHKATGSSNRFKPYGRALRFVGLKAHPDLPDDPQPTQGRWEVTIRDNLYGNHE